MLLRLVEVDLIFVVHDEVGVVEDLAICVDFVQCRGSVLRAVCFERLEEAVGVVVRPLTAAAVTSAHTQLVTGQPVRFTLGQAKARIPASARDGLAGQVLGLLPNDLGFTIVTPADAPQLYNTIDLFKSVWWWLGLIALTIVLTFVIMVVVLAVRPQGIMGRPA